MKLSETANCYSLPVYQEVYLQFCSSEEHLGMERHSAFLNIQKIVMPFTLVQENPLFHHGIQDDAIVYWYNLKGFRLDRIPTPKETAFLTGVRNWNKIA